MRTYYVYLMASPTRVLYIGVTNNLKRRVLEHKENRESAFTSRYGIHKLVHYESTNSIHVAIAREKQLKGWRRSKKVALIEANNPRWQDISQSWYGARILDATRIACDWGSR